MNRWSLAVAVLLAGAVGMASADYIVIIANVGHTKPVEPMGNPMGGFPGGSSLPPGGSSLPPGGSSLPPGGSSLPPGGSSLPPGGSGGQPSRPPGFGINGGLPGGSVPPGGSFPGQNGGQPEGQRILVGAVVEVKATFKELAPYSRPASLDPRLPSPRPIITTDRWGFVRLQNYRGAPLELQFIPLNAEKVPTVAERFRAKSKDVFKDKSGEKPAADKLQDLAEYALTHDLNDDFVGVMNKWAAAYPDNNAVKAFQTVQAALDRPVTRDDAAAWQRRLGDGYKTAISKGGKGHYLLFHNLSSNDQAEVQERLARLEDSMRTFYYWFALRGIALPVAEERQPALLTAKAPEFQRTRDSLTDPPVVADAFFARRPNLTVFCDRPLDPLYDMLDKASDPIWRHGNFVRQELVTGKEFAGYPKGTRVEDIAYADTLALLMKALEDETERAGVTNDASRQLLFASGLLPRGVAVPEWIQFGMGSFFETPEHSPWPTPAGPSTLYLPAYREEMRGKKFEGEPFKTMRKIVTDGYFHELTTDDLKNKSAAQLRARTAAWSLTYFLAEKKLDNLQRYFKILSEMPRNLDLDDATLWEAFARSFDAYDPKTKRIDDAKLSNLAAQWQDYVGNVQMESEDLVKELQKQMNDLKDQGDKPAQP